VAQDKLDINHSGRVDSGCFGLSAQANLCAAGDAADGVVQTFQKGETDTGFPIKEKGELGKLANEVEQVALSLRVARKSISEVASERLQKDELWTEAKLRDLIHAKLGDNAFFVDFQQGTIYARN